MPPCGPSPAMRRNFSSGFGIGSTDANTAEPTIATIHTTAIQPTMPIFFVADFSTTTGVGAAARG